MLIFFSMYTSCFPKDSFFFLFVLTSVLEAFLKCLGNLDYLLILTSEVLNS